MNFRCRRWSTSPTGLASQIVFMTVLLAGTVFQAFWRGSITSFLTVVNLKVCSRYMLSVELCVSSRRESHFFQYPFMTLEDLVKTRYILEYPAGYSIVDTMSQAEEDDIYGRLWRMVSEEMSDRKLPNLNGFAG